MEEKIFIGTQKSVISTKNVGKTKQTISRDTL